MSKIIKVPFSGFYCTWHDSELDHELNQMFSDRETGSPNEDLVLHAHDACRWWEVHCAYAEAYCEAFAKEFNLELEFDELRSPKEYNFETDRIFARISTEQVERLHRLTPDEDLRRTAREWFTSRSGFMSFYSPDIEDWATWRSGTTTSSAACCRHTLTAWSARANGTCTRSST